ncbi:glycosyltransferase family 4 protein, partial [Acidobacteria bacterium ACD]|nr:glycosyltransferase family 4 protein [Acidobacteria bacterium ACD]
VPSRSDSFPGVVLEALACGVPVIGSRVGGIPDVVTEGTNGLLVPPGRPRQLASAIARVAGDKNLLASMEGAARGSVWPRFAWEETGRQLRSVVAGVAGLGPEAGVVGGC